MIQPMNDWVLVNIDPLPNKKGSIFVLEDSTVNTVRTGTVVSTGRGKKTSTGVIPTGLEKGEKVAFFRWNLEHKNGQQISAFLEGIGEELGLIKASDILFAYSAHENIEVGQ